MRWIAMALVLASCATPDSPVAIETVTETVTERVTEYVTLPPEAPTSEPTSKPASGDALTWNGTGYFASEPFELNGGAYTAAWAIDGNCSARFWLSNPATGRAIEDMGGAAGPNEGSRTIYGVDADRYYLDVVAGDRAGCAWHLTITSRTS